MSQEKIQKVPSSSASDEKGAERGQVHTVPADDDRYHFDTHDLDQVQRRLQQRHVQMIAIAGKYII